MSTISPTLIEQLPVLRERLIARFNQDDLRGKTTGIKAHSLLEQMERRGWLPGLLACLQQLRPNGDTASSPPNPKRTRRASLVGSKSRPNSSPTCASIASR